MSNSPLTIWSNAKFSDEVVALLQEGVAPHRLVFAPSLEASNLVAAPPDPQLAEADVAFGQPDPQSVIDNPKLKWVHLSTAGYTRYDNDAVREAVKSRGGALTNSSAVYAEPCAEHALAFMLAHARQLPQSLDVQRGDRSWPYLTRRAASHLLTGQSVVILGYGAIARRLTELLAPFRMKISALRRTPKGDEGVEIFAPEQLGAKLAEANHVVNILPDSPATRGVVNNEFLAQVKKGAVFYNIGRGTTVDQYALISALQSGQLASAYLDVTDPEPLPPEHPLWTAPNCFITPHTAGGFAEEEVVLVRHFVENVKRYAAGEALVDRVF